ncbi:chorismate synthase 2, chloroplastic-like isoform X3 [Vitis riparia]|uniref:chorismate synthase 2, chloroplastic-like isoform X3 n=1 Tax=Vitis riparia TaxID=96939 RepID=UPI00155A3670|nr:chorismate synthase 2, chloroplastic-like isoform X3 [Vitis riparia]
MSLSLIVNPFLRPPRTNGVSESSHLFCALYPAKHIRPEKLKVQASGNTLGTYFRVTTYEESRGGGVGCIIDGCPPRIPLSEADVQVELDRRRPGQSRLVSPRKETDTCQIYSGIAEGLTTGSPIMVHVPNTDQTAHDYSELSRAYRPSHADATYDFKYGVRAIQGGGRSSARETIARVAAGAVAKKILMKFSGTEVLAYVSQVHNVRLPEHLVDHESLNLDQVEESIVRCPNAEYAKKMIAAIDAVMARGESVGGVVSCMARNVPRGLGSPVFNKLEAELARAAMSLPASIGFEFGSGFAGTLMSGSEHNDEFYIDKRGRIRTRTNHSGGIQGGISNGEVLSMRIAFKPTPTIELKQHTVTRDKHETEILSHIRRDPCVAPRAVPVVESMIALVLVDQIMAQYAQCELFPINTALQEPMGSLSSTLPTFPVEKVGCVADPSVGL